MEQRSPSAVSLMNSPYYLSSSLNLVILKMKILLDELAVLLYRISTMNDITKIVAEANCCNKLPGRGCCTESGEFEKEFAQLAKALAHPVRVAILRLLLDRNECICGEICDCIPLAQSTISQHLKTMKEAGLILGEVDGPRICYCVNKVKLQQLKALIAAL